jgi:hypothetical protein
MLHDPKVALTLLSAVDTAECTCLCSNMRHAGPRKSVGPRKSRKSATDSLVRKDSLKGEFVCTYKHQGCFIWTLETFNVVDNV